ncbi:hypothetical protein [Streptomyces sp. NPDC050485]
MSTSPTSYSVTYHHRYARHPALPAAHDVTIQSAVDQIDDRTAPG